MAYQPNPNDPYRDTITDAPPRRPVRLDEELPPDPELAEVPSSGGGRIAMFAIAIAVVLGAVFYGLNHTTINQAGTTPTSQTAQTPATPANPAVPPNMRDISPRPNIEPGATTGSAANRPNPPAAPTTSK